MLEFDSCNIITLPILLYLLKDNVDLSEMSQNFTLNASILILSMLVSKKNFQASVYLMFTFIFLQVLGSTPKVFENFENNSNKTKISVGAEDPVKETNNMVMQRLVEEVPVEFPRNLRKLEPVPEEEPLEEQNDNDVLQDDLVLGFSSHGSHNYACF